MPPTKHTHPVVFGRKVEGCPRCAELAAGAPPVRWAKDAQAERNAMFQRALQEHNCTVSKCGPVCTFGDW